MMSRFALLLGVAACLAGPLAHDATAGDPVYQYIDLGTLGGNSSVAMGLNDARQVVGWSSIPACAVNGHECRRAFLWDDGVMTDLGILPGDEESVARAINNHGLVVGTSERDVVGGSGVVHGFTWDGTLTPLSDLGLGQSFAHDVNDAGQVVGHTQDPTVHRDRAVRWDAGVITDIGATESHSYNRAYGISEGGVVVGFAWNLFSPNDATLFDGNTWFTIGGIDGPFQNAEAYDVNDHGLAVGLQAFPSGAWHPALWPVGAPAVDLGLFPGTNLGELFDVNDAGLAVGRCYSDFDPDFSRAAFYDGTSLIDLNDLLPDGVDGVLFEAREINAHGDIAGTALVDGKFRAFLMVEVSETAPWTDLGLGLAGTAGVPQLGGTGTLCAGDDITVGLVGARPSSLAYLVVGAAEVNLPFYGGTLVPAFEAPLGLFLALGTGPAGSLELTDTWPAGIPSGLQLTFQYWIVDPVGPFGFAASNAIRGTVP